MESTWAPMKGGATIGTSGSESGTIVLDDEHPNGARITIERATQVAPFAITCGIYGAMVHTRFLGSETEARRECDAMKRALEAIMTLMLADRQSKGGVYEALQNFVADFP